MPGTYLAPRARSSAAGARHGRLGQAQPHGGQRGAFCPLGAQLRGALPQIEGFGVLFLSTPTHSRHILPPFCCPSSCPLLAAPLACGGAGVTIPRCPRAEEKGRHCCQQCFAEPVTALFSGLFTGEERSSEENKGLRGAGAMRFRNGMWDMRGQLVSKRLCGSTVTFKNI